jgi:hypothetical protein
MKIRDLRRLTCSKFLTDESTLLSGTLKILVARGTRWLRFVHSYLKNLFLYSRFYRMHITDSVYYLVVCCNVRMKKSDF